MGANSDRWMPLYITKYDQATNRLSLAEDGAYMRLIRDYWLNGPPPDDDATLARILRVERREWAKIRPAIQHFFEIVGGKWTHDTVDRELDRARELIEKRREAGKQGGRPPKQPESTPKPNALANGKQTGSQTETPARVALPLPSPDGELKDADASFVASASPKTTAAVPKLEPFERCPEFVQFWSTAPPLMRKRAKSMAKVWPEWVRAVKLAPPAAIIAGFVRYKALDGDIARTGGPGLHIWLRDRTWEQWTGATEGAERIGDDWPESRWARAVELWRGDGSWDDRLGPIPGAPGCRVPAGLVLQPLNQGSAA